MQLETSFRGLTPDDSATATRLLEKHAARFDRLIEEPCTLRAVIEEGPEFRVTLLLHTRRGEMTASATAHEIHEATTDACDKLKVQIVRQVHRAEAGRHRAVAT